MQFLAQLLHLFGALSVARVALAFDHSRNDNIVTYWGQNSYGATHEGDTGNWQQRLAKYCEDDNVNVFPLAFVDTFFSTGGLPSMNLGGACDGADSRAIPGTALSHCGQVAQDINTCQANGKIITISLGGATGGAHFTSDNQARQFADTIWDTFLGGKGDHRPFGDSVLDGIDLDIEGGGSSGYIAFVEQLRSHFDGASKKFYVTAAPQCPYPDEYLSAALNGAHFDSVYVQFYNNYCSVAAFSDPNSWNFATWDKWAKETSANKDVKIYIGALASKDAGGFGYVDAPTLSKIAKDVQSKYSSFGGVMFWDISQAYGNGHIHQTVKAALIGGASAPKPPSSSSSTTVVTSRITGTSTSSINSPKPTGTPTSTDTPAPSVSPAPAPASSCAGVPAWSSKKIFSVDDKVAYKGQVFTAKWWTHNETPGTTGEWGVWDPNGACTEKRDVSTDTPATQPVLHVVAPVKLPKQHTAPAKRADARSHWSRRHRSAGH